MEISQEELVHLLVAMQGSVASMDSNQFETQIQVSYGSHDKNTYSGYCYVGGLKVKFTIEDTED